MHASADKLEAPSRPWSGAATRSRDGSRRRRLAPALGEWGPLVALLILVAAFAAASPQFATLTNLQTILEASAVPLIVATGLTFVILQGSIDLSIEGITALTAMTLSLLVANTSTAMNLGWVGPAFVLVIGASFGLANGVLHHFLRMPSLIVTLGTWFVGLGLAALLFPARQPQILDAGLLALSGLKPAGVSPIVFIAVAVLALALVAQRMTRFGRLSYAIGEDERLVRLSGVPVGRFKITAYVLSGLTAALAGILLTSQMGVGNPTAGQNFLFPAISAAVIGGTLLSGARGGVLHTALGVLILQVLENGMVLVGANPLIQQIVEGTIITVAVAAGGYAQIGKLRVVK